MDTFQLSRMLCILVLTAIGALNTLSQPLYAESDRYAKAYKLDPLMAAASAHTSSYVKHHDIYAKSYKLDSLLAAASEDIPAVHTDVYAKSYKLDPLLAAASEDQPMEHNDNYEMIMPDYYDQNPAASMPYQDFQTFYDPERVENSEYNMDEAQFLQSTPVRAPQPLSADERLIRQSLEPVDVQQELKNQRKLKKGSTKPRPDAEEWDQFDYDLYSVNPGDSKKNIYG